MNIKERKQDRWLLGTVIVLVIFGLSILFSASWIKSLEVTDGASRMYFFQNQLIMNLLIVWLMICLKIKKTLMKILKLI